MREYLVPLSFAWLTIFTNFTNSGGHGTLHGMTFGIRTQRLLHLPIPRHPLPTDEGQRRDRNVFLFKDFLRENVPEYRVKSQKCGTC